MRETQNVEWKASWRDEYVKWICGFANANGGTLFIGKNDKGEIVGVENATRLLEEIPNKVRDVLGIIVEVNHHSEAHKDFVEIKVESYPYPISYKGQYHYRSGSTKQELKGSTLDLFLLQKQGKKWDSVPVPKVVAHHLKSETIETFKTKALRSNRLGEEALKGELDVLLENLRLKEDEFLKRACIMLFHPDPEKYVTGAYIKIGFFESETELVYQDEIHGNLIEQSDKVMDLLLTKYLKAYISYEGINRIERYLFPKEALREALLNAIVHKDYSSGVPIQIRVYGDKIMIWNEGQLPENWTVETLKDTHPSKPFNPDIANVFFRAGLIESWGRGIEKISHECELNGLPTPDIRYDSSSYMLKINAQNISSTDNKVLGVSEETQGGEKMSEEVSEETQGGEKMSEEMSEETQGGEKMSEEMSEETQGGEKMSEEMSEETQGGEKMSEKTPEKILLHIKRNNQITILELSERIGVTKRTIERNLQKLQEHEKIVRVGSTKSGYWKIL